MCVPGSLRHTEEIDRKNIVNQLYFNKKKKSYAREGNKVKVLLKM